MNLSASQWASRKWHGQPSTSGLGLGLGLGISPARPDNVPEAELSKHKKLLARLKWKSHLLVASHQRVTQAMQGPSPGIHNLSATEAETMFKLDFFEYYVLLERVILHLLGVFNIAVSSDLGKDGSNHTDSSGTINVPTNDAPIIGSSYYDRTYYHHRFHANVLQALDRPSNPLHAVLGKGDVRYYLGIAKESRNRWKDAEEEQAPGLIPGSGALKHQRMLKNVDLEVMLACILEAMDKAQVIAEDHARFSGRMTNGTTLGPQQAGVRMEYDMEDAPLEAMPDAMEWEEF